jgi:hypothetical protein
MNNFMKIRVYIFFQMFMFSFYSYSQSNREIKSVSGEGYIISIVICDYKNNNHSYSRLFYFGDNSFLDSLPKPYMAEGYDIDTINLAGYLYDYNVLFDNLNCDSLFEYSTLTYYSNSVSYDELDSLSLQSISYGMIDIITWISYRNYMSKSGLYYRIEKVKVDAILVKYMNFDEYLKDRMLNSNHNKNGEYNIGSWKHPLYAKMTPVCGRYSEPYWVLIAKRAYFYNDWFLTPLDSNDDINLFYDWLYIGEKKKRREFPRINYYNDED